MGPLARALSLVAACGFGLGVALAAAAQQPNCVTVCQDKVDACGAQCEALADTVYRDPASFQECQLSCAKGLFTSCVEQCSQTGEVVSDDYGIAAPNPDRVPAPAEPPAQ